MSFRHSGHPHDREQHRRFVGKEYTNELTPELREALNVDPRLLGARVNEDGSQDKSSIDPNRVDGELLRAKKVKGYEWVFWQRDHDLANA